MLFWILLLFISIVIVSKGADIFIENVEKISIKYGISKSLIGMSIVSFGTTTPELFSSLLSIVENAEEIVAGNIIGSNIANICIILSISSMISKMYMRNMKKYGLFLLFYTIVFILFIIDGYFEFSEASIMLILSIPFLVSFKKDSKKFFVNGSKKVEESTYQLLITIAFTLFMVYLSADVLVKSVIEISNILFVGKETIALTLVAVGTSIPELSVAVIASIKKKTSIVIGNIIGANLFNIFLVMSASSFFTLIPVKKNLITLALPVLFASTTIFSLSLLKEKFGKLEGTVLIILYIFFLLNLNRYLI